MAKTTQARGKTGLKWGAGSIVERGGKFVARWPETGGDGRRHRKARTFSDHEAAEDHLRAIHRGRQDGSYVPPAELTVREVIDDWLLRGESRWKPSTVSHYRQRAETHVYPVFGKLKADALTTPRIQHWIDGMVRAGLNASTIDSSVRVLGGALREASQIGIVARNPVQGVRRPPVKMTSSVTWTIEEVARVMATLTGERKWDALYRLALATGMRPGELRALAWADINFETGVVTVRRTITKDADGHVIMGTSTKTGRARPVALAASTLKALKAWRVEQAAHRLASERGAKDDIVFDRGDGRWLPLSTWQKRHVRLCEAAGVSLITLHGLRHTSATLEFEAGVHPKIVSERLGHQTIQTTLDRYTHMSTALQRSAADALDARLFGVDQDDSGATTSEAK